MVKRFGQPEVGLASHQMGSRLYDEFSLGDDRRVGCQLLTQAKELLPCWAIGWLWWLAQDGDSLRFTIVNTLPESVSAKRTSSIS